MRRGEGERSEGACDGRGEESGMEGNAMGGKARGVTGNT